MMKFEVMMIICPGQSDDNNDNEKNERGRPEVSASPLFTSAYLI